jgi:hypothetical protein
MAITIERATSNSVLTIAASAALSEAIDMRPFTGGVISMPAAWTAASISFKVSAASNGTFQPLYDKNGTLVAVTAAAATEIALPAEVFGSRFIKLWSETAGADVTQDAARSITVSLKG